MRPNLRTITMWNKLVDEVFNHPKSEYSIFVYEMMKRRVLGTKDWEYRGTPKMDKKYGVKNIDGWFVKSSNREGGKDE